MFASRAARERTRLCEQAIDPGPSSSFETRVDEEHGHAEPHEMMGPPVAPMP